MRVEGLDSAREESGFDFSQASKFPAGAEYFDVNYLWVPGLKHVVGAFYRVNIRPEAVVGMSLVAGCLAALSFAGKGYQNLLWGILWIQIKNYLDTVDGHLARAMRLDSRVGRFLDSLSDFVVYLFLFTALGLRLKEPQGWPALVLSYGAMLSAFIQCSYYNYYLVEYLRTIGSRTRSRTDERCQEREGQDGGSRGKLLVGLKQVYLVVYGWQDQLVASLDRWARWSASRRLSGKGNAEWVSADQWYTDKRLLAANSPLCFGTQILVLTILSLGGQPELFLYFLLGPANLYLLVLLLLRPRFVS